MDITHQHGDGHGQQAASKDSNKSSTTTPHHHFFILFISLSLSSSQSTTDNTESQENWLGRASYSTNAFNPKAGEWAHARPTVIRVALWAHIPTFTTCFGPHYWVNFKAQLACLISQLILLLTHWPQSHVCSELLPEMDRHGQGQLLPHVSRSLLIQIVLRGWERNLKSTPLSPGYVLTCFKCRKHTSPQSDKDVMRSFIPFLPATMRRLWLFCILQDMKKNIMFNYFVSFVYINYSCLCKV